MSESQKYRLRSAGFKRDIVAPVEAGQHYVDRESGTEFVVVGEVLPVGPTTSTLPWSEENLRICGCSREQLVQKDINDCPYCDRRIPAAQAGESTSTGSVAAPAETAALADAPAEAEAATEEPAAAPEEAAVEAESTAESTADEAGPTA